MRGLLHKPHVYPHLPSNSIALGMGMWETRACVHMRTRGSEEADKSMRREGEEAGAASQRGIPEEAMKIGTKGTPSQKRSLRMTGCRPCVRKLLLVYQLARHVPMPAETWLPCQALVQVWSILTMEPGVLRRRRRAGTAAPARGSSRQESGGSPLRKVRCPCPDGPGRRPRLMGRTQWQKNHVCRGLAGGGVSSEGSERARVYLKMS